MRLTFTRLMGSLLLLLGLSSFAYAQTATVQGQITDPRGEAVPGITVMLNDSRGVATDVSGNFTISNIPPGNHTLSVSGVGYQTQTLSVTLTAGQDQTNQHSPGRRHYPDGGSGGGRKIGSYPGTRTSLRGNGHQC